jgi:cytochrome P450
MFLALPILLVPFVLCLIWWNKFAPRRYKLKHSSGTLPPGPPEEPIIGHVRLIPEDRPQLTYMKWGKEYNTDILYLNLLGKPVIVLNSIKVATDLLERRGAKYSDRPGFHFLLEQGFRESLGFYSTGPQFRKHRKMFQNEFTVGNCVAYKEAQQQEARKLIARILKKPEDWRAQVVMFATIIILRIAYGLPVKERNDPYLEIAEKISHGVSEGGSAGATMVDIFPIVRYLPKWLSIFPSLKFARSFYPHVRELYELPFSATKANMANGVAETSFTKKMLEEMDEEKGARDSETSLNPITVDDIKGAAATIYIAGQDTTHTTITFFILNMTRNPDVQRKAWKEIESVCGPDRLPTFSDRDMLPYVEYIIQETLRQNPAAPLGLPHKSAEDDYYNGYLIPKGTSL